MQNAECTMRSERLRRRLRCPRIVRSAFGIAFAPPSPPTTAEILDRVLAVAAGEPITLSDVTAARDFGLVAVDASAADPVAAVLSKLIERELILAEVDRFAPAEPSAEVIDQEIAGVRSRSFRAGVDRRAGAIGHRREPPRQTLREDRASARAAQRFIVPSRPMMKSGVLPRHAAVFTRGGSRFLRRGAARDRAADCRRAAAWR